jgi:hypothetical protein
MGLLQKAIKTRETNKGLLRKALSVSSSRPKPGGETAEKKNSSLKTNC